MGLENVYSSIDFGHDSCKLVVGTMNGDRFNLCATFVAKTNGLADGEITSKNELQRTIVNLLEQARELDFEVNQVVVVLPPYGMKVVRKKARMPVSSPNGIISIKDIENLEKYCAESKLTPGEMVVGINALSYTVDNQVIEKDRPIGYKGNQLSIEAFVITSPTNLAKNIVELVEDLELQVLDVILAPLASAKLLVRDEDAKKGLFITDIGSHFNSVAFIYKGLLCGYKESKNGGSMITDELAKIINKDHAESDRVKKFYGSAIAAEASEENVYLDENLKVSYKEKDIAQVIETNLELIITDVRINTNTLSKNERLPLILVGGVANTPLIAEKMKMMLENQILERNVDLIGAEDTTYYCAIGGLLKFLTENV